MFPYNQNAINAAAQFDRAIAVIGTNVRFSGVPVPSPDVWKIGKHVVDSLDLDHNEVRLASDSQLREWARQYVLWERSKERQTDRLRTLEVL